MCRSREEEEMKKQQEIRELERQIAETDQMLEKLQMLKQRKRANLQHQNGLPGGVGAARNIKDRLGSRRLQDNPTQRALPQPWLSGTPPEGFKRPIASFAQKPLSAGPLEEFQRKFAMREFSQKASSNSQSCPAREGHHGHQVLHRHEDLPADLVLTEITEEGPRAKVPAVIREKEKEVVEEEEEEEEDLDRYENGDDFFVFE